MYVVITKQGSWFCLCVTLYWTLLIYTVQYVAYIVLADSITICMKTLVK